MTWDFWQRAGGFLRPGVRVLSIGVEDRDKLLALGHPFQLLSVAEGPGTYAKACRRLAPLGVTVRQWAYPEPLPFAGSSMGLLLGWHALYDLAEAYRVLKPGGFFLAGQVGARDCQAAGLPPDFNLENQLPLFRAAGFRVMYSQQAYREAAPWQLEHRFIIIAKKRAGGEGK